MKLMALLDPTVYFLPVDSVVLDRVSLPVLAAGTQVESVRVAPNKSITGNGAKDEIWISKLVILRMSELVMNSSAHYAGSDHLSMSRLVWRVIIRR